MAELVIHDIAETVIQRLQSRAERHSSTVELEAREILTRALGADSTDPWAAIDAVRDQLQSTGRAFDDSTESLREDRSR
jgi:plasmid stability protein